MSKGGNNKLNTAQVSGGFLIGLICLSRSTSDNLGTTPPGQKPLPSGATFVPGPFWNVGMFAAQHKLINKPNIKTLR